LEQLGTQGPSGRRIEHGDHAILMRQVQSVSNRLDRHLQLDEHDVGAGDRLSCRFHIRRREGLVGARGDDNHVLTLSVHDDEGDARMRVAGAAHVGRRYTLVTQVLFRPVAQVVDTELDDHSHLSTQARRSHGLVGTLAARPRAVVTAEDRLAPHRDARRPDQQVRIVAPHDHDPGSLDHCMHLLAYDEVTSRPGATAPPEVGAAPLSLCARFSTGRIRPWFRTAAARLTAAASSSGSR